MTRLIEHSKKSLSCRPQVIPANVTLNVENNIADKQINPILLSSVEVDEFLTETQRDKKQEDNKNLIIPTVAASGILLSGIFTNLKFKKLGLLSVLIGGATFLISLSNNKRNNVSETEAKTLNNRNELAASWHTKLDDIVEHGKKSSTPIIADVKDGFITNFANRLASDSNKNILIGLTGESASGKSTICKKIKDFANTYNLPIVVISADDYFKDISHLIKKYGDFDALRNSGYDVDAPSNFQLEQLKEDLTLLSNGSDVKIPQYLINGTGISQPQAKLVQPQKIIIVEGIATMYEDVADLFDAKIYVDVDKNVQKDNFFKRAKSRNQSNDEVIKHWNYVSQAAEKYIRPFKNNADLVINGHIDLQKYEDFFKYICSMTNNII